MIWVKMCVNVPCDGRFNSKMKCCSSYWQAVAFFLAEKEAKKPFFFLIVLFYNSVTAIGNGSVVVNAGRKFISKDKWNVAQDEVEVDVKWV